MYPPHLVPHRRTSVVLLTFAILCASCAPAGLSNARKKIAAGQYDSAHGDLVALKTKEKNLDPAQRREVDDDFCLTEFMIGRPTYPLGEQHRACADAAAEPGSQSGPMLEKVDAEYLSDSARRVDDALKAGDLMAAEDAAFQYRATPGADPAMMKKWAAKMWKLADAQVAANSNSPRAVTPAIAQLTKGHPNLRGTDDHQFAAWVRKTAIVNGRSLVERVEIGQHSLKVWIPEDSVAAVARHLDRITAINDGFVARCGCDARTDVGVSETGFPAYLVKLDPETHMSEVLILPRGQLSEASPPA